MILSPGMDLRASNLCFDRLSPNAKVCEGGPSLASEADIGTAKEFVKSIRQHQEVMRKAVMRQAVMRSRE
jgi:hypothetical protein